MAMFNPFGWRGNTDKKKDQEWPSKPFDITKKFDPTIYPDKMKVSLIFSKIRYELAEIQKKIHEKIKAAENDKEKSSSLVKTLKVDEENCFARSSEVNAWLNKFEAKGGNPDATKGAMKNKVR